MKENLKLAVYKWYDGEISTAEFEQFIYDNSEIIEAEEAEELFLDVLSFNYKSKYAKQAFFSLFDENIDWKDYEERRINQLLDSIIEGDENFGESLLRTYELSNEGYRFFANLGLVHGLNIISEFKYEKMISWEEMSKDLKVKILRENHQEAKAKALEIKEWLKDGKVILTGKRDNSKLNDYIYEDNRGTEEIKGYEIDTPTYRKREQPRKKWWQIWKK